MRSRRIRSPAVRALGGVLRPRFVLPVVKPFALWGERGQVAVGRQVAVGPVAAVGGQVAIWGQVVFWGERRQVAVTPKAAVWREAAVLREAAIRPWLTERPHVRPAAVAPVAVRRAGVGPPELRSYLPVMAVAVGAPVGQPPVSARALACPRAKFQITQSGRTCRTAMVTRDAWAGVGTWIAVVG
jgi:hypothetical protein